MKFFCQTLIAAVVMLGVPLLASAQQQMIGYAGFAGFHFFDGFIDLL